MPPTLDRFGSSLLTRNTEKLLPGRSPTSAVCMFSAPTFRPPALPLSRPPPMIGTSSPFSSSPIRRLKNRSSSCPLPMVNSSEFSWKNGRFSGNRRLKRVRLICCVSTSTCAKSVLTVASRFRLGVMPNLASRPMSPSKSVGVARREVAVGRPDRVGQQLEVARRLQLQAAQFACRRQPPQVEHPLDRRPVGALAGALDVTKEVDAPGLGRRAVTQCPKRDAELGGPGRFGHPGRHVPAAVPTGLLVALEADLRVVLHAGGVGAEHEPVLLVLECVEDHLERVHVAQIGVAARVGGHDLRRIGVEQRHANVDRLSS